MGMLRCWFARLLPEHHGDGGEPALQQQVLLLPVKSGLQPSRGRRLLVCQSQVLAQEPEQVPQQLALQPQQVPGQVLQRQVPEQELQLPELQRLALPPEVQSRVLQPELALQQRVLQPVPEQALLQQVQ